MRFYNSFCYGEVGDYGKAKENISIYIENRPTKSAGYQNRAYYNRKLKLYDEAIADYTKWIGLEPLSYDAYLERAKAYCDKNLKALAQADEEKGVSLGGIVTQPCR